MNEMKKKMKAKNMKKTYKIIFRKSTQLGQSLRHETRAFSLYILHNSLQCCLRTTSTQLTDCCLFTQCCSPVYTTIQPTSCSQGNQQLGSYCCRSVLLVTKYFISFTSTLHGDNRQSLLVFCASYQSN